MLGVEPCPGFRGEQTFLLQGSRRTSDIEKGYIEHFLVGCVRSTFSCGIGGGN